nr:uncharacterized protein LOC129262209 [Lytechinus pictus]
MRRAISLVLLVLVCAVEMIGAEMVTCYQCEQVDSPVGTDCWNASQTLPTVECEHSCFTSMFQSGGNYLDNYWNVKRGCVEACDGSSNCLSQHYGACKYCCSSNLCNDYVNSPAVNVRISLPLLVITALGCLAWL